MSETNQELARRTQKALNELGYKFPLGHAFELLSKLNGCQSWNEARAKGIDLKVEDAEIHILERPELPPIRFKGKLIAEIRVEQDQFQDIPYSETWDVLKLYKTVRNRYVCYRSIRLMFRDTGVRILVKDTEAEVVEFFGLDSLAIDLYKKAGINYFEEFDIEEVPTQPESYTQDGVYFDGIQELFPT